MARPSALFISPGAPARTGNGLAMRMGVFLEALTRVADTELLLLPFDSSPSPEIALARELGVKVTVIPVYPRQGRLLPALKRLPVHQLRLAAFRLYGQSSRSALLSRAILSDVAVFGAGRHFDLIHVGRQFIAESAAAIDSRRRTLDLDEDEVWSKRTSAEVARADKRPRDADWFNAEAAAYDRQLSRLGPSFDKYFISGPADLAALQSRHPSLPVSVAENGVDFPVSPERADDSCTVLFVGTLNYRPNVDGIVWFCDRVWPQVHAQLGGNARLRIAGHHSAPIFDELATRPGIEVLGRVPDLAATYGAATVVIAPLFEGGGTRIKLIEAAAHGVPIVTTPLAARGLPLAPDSSWLAADPQGFATAVLEALRTPELRAAKADLALAAIRPQHDRATLVDRISQHLDMVARG